MSQPPASDPYGAPGPAQPPGGGAFVAEGKGLMGSLFDFSFRHFATPHIVRIVYILATVMLGVGALFTIISGFAMIGSRQAAAGIVLILLTPLGFLLYLALLRMTMEMYVAVTRAADELSRIRDALSRR